MTLFIPQEKESLYELAPQMAKTIHTLLLARKESSQAFLKASYSSEVQAVFDLVEGLNHVGS